MLSHPKIAMPSRRNSRAGPPFKPRVERVDDTTSRVAHVTPRNSDGEETIAAPAVVETPYSTLRKLANISSRPTTPLRATFGIAQPSTHGSTRRTPIAAARTPGAIQRIIGSEKKGNTLTPHGRAAMREVDARRAGLTPGNDRRRSGRQQRETPRDNLRLLSRTLAPKSQLIEHTPQDSNVRSRRFTLPEHDDVDDGSDLEVPRLSMPLEEDEEEDDSLLLPPPQSAGLEDDNFTVRSIELPRRATREELGGRLSGGSFDSIRTIDRFADINDMGLNGPRGEKHDSSFITGDNFEENEVPNTGFDHPLQRYDTASLRDLSLERERISLTAGRNSDIRPLGLPPDDNETTFVFTLPQRDILERRQSDVRPDSATEDDENRIEYYEMERTNLELHEARTSQNGIDIDISMQNTTSQIIDSIGSKRSQIGRKRKVKVSKHGLQYPSLPAGVVKNLATTFARTGANSKTKLSKDTLDAIMQASEWFFEQVCDDLCAYSQHAGRKTIDESDVIALLSRQRQTNTTTTPFSLAQRYLPRELLQDLRMGVPLPKLKRVRQPDKLQQADNE